MKRFIILLYGLVVYAFFLGTFAYAIGFIGDMWVPKTINSGAVAPFGNALLINALLLAAFAIQHTIMARPGFKRAWTKIIPESAERSTFVLITNLILCLMFWQWRPMPEIVWQVTNPAGIIALKATFWMGWGIVLVSTFLIDHFELFGVRQVITQFRGQEFKLKPFVEWSLYKMVRHPIMLGFAIAFWSMPTMTIGSLFFAIMTTGYILVGVLFEERDLRAAHGERYKEYASRVPRLIPFTKFGKPRPSAPEVSEPAG